MQKRTPATRRPPLPAVGEGATAGLRPAPGHGDEGGGEGVRPVTARGRLDTLVGSLKAFLYGMTGYEFERHALQERARLEDLFVLVTLGDIIGVPILPP